MDLAVSGRHAHLHDGADRGDVADDERNLRLIVFAALVRPVARDNQVRLERNPLAERFPLLGALVGQVSGKVLFDTGKVSVSVEVPMTASSP